MRSRAGPSRDLGPVTPERLAVFACAFLIAGYAVLLMLAAVKGAWLVGPGGRPAPADFNGLWAAARLSVDGQAAEAYGWPALERVLTRAGRTPRADLQFPFFYPPVFLVWLKPLGALPYATAAVVWVTTTLVAYAASVRLISGRALPLLSALAAPAVLACVYVGQNGLLTSALAGAALAVLPKRPLLAGVLIGLIAYKPQFGVALPVLLLAGGRRNAAATAAATVVATYALAGVLLGWDVYARCLEQLIPRGGALPAIGTLPVEKLQSLYGLSRAIGAAAPMAWMIQGLGAIGATLLAARLWKHGAPWPLQAAAAAAVMLIVSPYSVLYDYPLLSIAIAFLLRDAERTPLTPVQGAALILAFAAPFAAAAFTLPLCPIGAILALAVAVRRVEPGITKVSPTAKHPNGGVRAS